MRKRFYLVRFADDGTVAGDPPTDGNMVSREFGTRYTLVEG
jgi:hypothetical protein